MMEADRQVLTVSPKGRHSRVELARVGAAG